MRRSTATSGHSSRRPRPSDFFVGVDLGQSQDPTAVAVLRRSTLDFGARSREPAHRYELSHIEELPLSLSYPQIVAHVAALVLKPEMRPPYTLSARYSGGHTVQPVEYPGMPSVCVDATGVGRAIVDLFLAGSIASTIVPLTITGGKQGRLGLWNDRREVPALWVPKCDLVGLLRVLLDSKRLAIGRAHPLAVALEKELQGFKMTLSDNGREAYGNDIRVNKHDDLVLALAMAAYLAEYRGPDKGLGRVVVTDPNPRGTHRAFF